MERIRIAPRFEGTADLVLYEGDCLDLLAQVPDGAVRLVVTSPPYNLGKAYEDRLDLAEYLEQQRRVIEECVRILDARGSICWQVGNYVDGGEIVPLDVVLYPIFCSLGLHLRNRIVWHFGHGLHASRRFSGRYEVILWFTNGRSLSAGRSSSAGDDYLFNLDAVRVPQKYPKKKHYKGPNVGKLSGNPLGKNPGDVWEIPNVKANHVEKTAHPCQFPVELVERLVLALTEEGDWVLDPFMGVGSTAIAALMHGRKAVGAEIMPEYVRIARERIALAERGELRIRPMARAVYDPAAPGASVPPQAVRLGATPVQPSLLERQESDVEHR